MATWYHETKRAPDFEARIVRCETDGTWAYMDEIEQDERELNKQLTENCDISLTIDPAACLLKIKMPDGTIRKIEPEKNLPISADLAGFKINGCHYSNGLGDGIGEIIVFRLPEDIQPTEDESRKLTVLKPKIDDAEDEIGCFLSSGNAAEQFEICENDLDDLPSYRISGRASLTTYIFDIFAILGKGASVREINKNRKK